MTDMKQLKEALIYATVNSVVAFTLYAGSALHFGGDIKAALTSAAGVAMLIFGSYMVKEEDAVDMPFNPSDLANKNRKGFTRHIPPCVRKHGLFRFI